MPVHSSRRLEILVQGDHRISGFLRFVEAPDADTGALRLRVSANNGPAILGPEEVSDLIDALSDWVIGHEPA